MKIISFDRIVKEKNLPEITSPQIFIDVKNMEYSINGLHSPVIYSNENLRRTQLAFIKVNQPFIHPILLKILKRSKPILYEGLMHINPVKIEKNSLKKDPEGLMGLDLLNYILDNIENLSSLFSPKLYKIFLEFKNELICNSVIVIPPVFRPITFLKENYPVLTEIDKMYIQLLNIQKENDIFSKVQSLVFQIEEEVFSIIKGKKGIIRDFVYSRRVDFSARTVITVDPTIDIDHMSIPYRVLAKIFAPEVIHLLLHPSGVIINYLKEHNLLFPKTIDGCLYLIDQFYNSKLSEEMETALEKVIEIATKGKMVIAKRDPVLHKHSVFSFYVKGVSSSVQKIYTCGISPLVTTPLNADFDGDTMAIFTTHTIEGNDELKKMLPSSNLFSVKNGELIFKLKNEYALAIFILTNGPDKFSKKEESVISKTFKYPEKLSEVLPLLKDYSPSTLIKVKFSDSFLSRREEITTLGRYIFNLTHNLSNFFINETLDKNKANNFFSKIFSLLEDKDLFRKFTLQITKLVDFVLHLYPVSFSIEDFEIPDILKKKLYESKNIIEFENNLNKIIEDVKNHIKINSPSLHVQLSSKARGGIDDIKQISIARGVITDPHNIIDINPIKESYFDGLSSENIYFSSPGWRTSIVDSRLSIATSGFLYKKLVFFLKNLKLNLYDCKTSSGLKLKVNNDLLFSLKGRYLLNNKNLIEQPEIYLNKEVILRSPIFCKDPHGICHVCYGKLSEKIYSNQIGHFAAQAIGEVSSQSLLRSFHTGGTASLMNVQSIISSLPQVFEFKDDLIYANTSISIEVLPENVKIFKEKIYIYPSFITINDLIHNTSFSYELPFVLIVKKENVEIHPSKIICNFSKHEKIGSLAFARTGVISAVEKLNSFLMFHSENFSNFQDKLMELYKIYISSEVPLIHFEVLFSELLRTDDNQLWRLNQHKPIQKISYLDVIKINNPIDAVVFYDPVTSIIDSLS